MTNPGTLLASTGNVQADDALRALTAACDAVLPERLRSVYVTGSYGDESALASSDLDVTLVFAGRLTAEERAAAEGAVAGVARECGVELDASVVGESKLAHGVPPLLKLGGRCVWGEDRRDAMPLVPIERWARERMHNAYALIVTIFRRPVPVALPLTYPDAGDEFLGYTRRAVRLADGRDVPSTRDLIRVTGWAATALVALYGRTYVARKREVPAAYRRHIGDEHAALHDDIAYWCREQWAYLLPDDAPSRARLRDLCARTLAFENRFLNEYREWV
ncbi:MAG TPA: hypothetical protein VJQ45_09265, partial [Ktedonobacterales bacterium]|nr:hypothetical protein [Ktedonobacterales bacterium]